MLMIVGLVVVIGATIAGYLMAGGALGVLVQPSEFVVIGGAALGSLLASTPMPVLKGISSQIVAAMGGGLTKADYVDLLSMLYQIFKQVQQGGAMSLEAHFDKPAPLTDDEADIVRTHAKIGFEMVSSLPSLQRLGHLIIATYERYDGCGYPSSLAGDEIPVGARVIAVADAYDALAAGRRYRAPMSGDDVNAELVRCAGTHFEPEVVRAWLRIDGGPLCS